MTFGFSEWVVVASSDITVTDPLGANVPVTIAGSPGDTISVSPVSPLTVEGVYTVTLKGTIKDALAGNAFNGGANATRTFTLDTTQPAATGYSLADDTGVSASDQITSDTTPVLTFNFSEPIDGTNAAVTVSNSMGPVTPDLITGWGTNALTIRMTQPGFAITTYQATGDFGTNIAGAEQVVSGVRAQFLDADGVHAHVQLPQHRRQRPLRR